MKDTSKLGTIVFAAVFAVVCGVGVSVAVYLADRNPKPAEVQTGSVFNQPKIKVHVKGEVNAPGLYELSSEQRVQDAVEAAGGLIESGDARSLNLAAFLKDGQVIEIPVKAPAATEPEQSTATGEPEQSTAQGSEKAPATAKAPAATGKVNINTADETQLDSLPGVGPSIAKSIIDYRNKNGDFGNIEDIINVPGIGQKKFEQIKNMICI